MKLRTFAFWRNARYPGLPPPPLVVNDGQPSEARLIARGDKVFIYTYTGLDHPNLGGLPPSRPLFNLATKADLAGRQSATNTPRHHTTMAKKAPTAPAKKGAAKAAPAKKGAAKAAPAKKGGMMMK